jgi:hypothetical protein
LRSVVVGLPNTITRRCFVVDGLWAVWPFKQGGSTGNPVEGAPSGLGTRVSTPGRVRPSLR